MNKTVILGLITFSIISTSVIAIPQTLNLDFQMHNDTGTVKNTTFTGTVKIYELGGASVYSTAVAWKTDNSGVGNIFLTNLDLANDLQYELTIQPTGETESDKLNISGNLQALFAGNSTYAAGVNWNDVTNVPAGFADGTDDVDDADASATNELQDLWETISSDSGSTAANTNTDTLTVSGGGNVTTSISADTLTINALIDTFSFLDLHSVYAWITSSFGSEVATNFSAINGSLANLNATSTTDELYDDGFVLNNISQLRGNLTGADTNETVRFDTLIGTDCGAGDFMNGVDADGTPSCGTPIGGGGGAGDKWLVNSSLNAITPNATFSQNIATLGFGNFSIIYATDWSNAPFNASSTTDEIYDDTTITLNFIDMIAGNRTSEAANTDLKVLGNVTTDTNANTICSGTTTYLDGEGNCDDISSVYEPAGITESDISDLQNYLLNNTEHNTTKTTTQILTLQNGSNTAPLSVNLSGCIILQGSRDGGRIEVC